MKNEDPLNVLVCLNKVSGSVHYAKCTCIANALSRCSHIVALLFYISQFSAGNLNSNTSYNPPTLTYLPC